MAQRKFRYRLEKVLDFKKKREEEEKEKLGKLLQEEVKEKELKAQLEQTLADVRYTLKTKHLHGNLNIEELRFYPQHIKNLENRIRYQELRLQELAIKIVEQRKALLKAAQERQKYEKHREKCEEEWLAEIEAEERRLIDELATIKFAREIRAQQEGC